MRSVSALELLDALVGSVRPAVSRKQIKQRLLLRQGGEALPFSCNSRRSRCRLIVRVVADSSSELASLYSVAQCGKTKGR